MPFISRDQVDPKVRKKFDAEHKARLRRILSDLAIVPGQGTRIETTIFGGSAQTESPRSEEVPTKPKNSRKGRRNK